MANAPNNMENERSRDSGFGNNRRVADAAPSMVILTIAFHLSNELNKTIKI